MLPQESVISTSKENPREVKRREAKLRAVFNQFDIDGGGWIEASELLALGKAWLAFTLPLMLAPTLILSSTLMLALTLDLTLSVTLTL